MHASRYEQHLDFTYYAYYFNATFSSVTLALLLQREVVILLEGCSRSRH